MCSTPSRAKLRPSALGRFCARDGLRALLLADTPFPEADVILAPFSANVLHVVFHAWSPIVEVAAALGGTRGGLVPRGRPFLDTGWVVKKAVTRGVVAMGPPDDPS